METIHWVWLVTYFAVGAVRSAARTYAMLKLFEEKYGIRDACDIILFPGVAIGVFTVLFWPIDIAISIIRERMYGDKKQ